MTVQEEVKAFRRSKWGPALGLLVAVLLAALLAARPAPAAETFTVNNTGDPGDGVSISNADNSFIGSATPEQRNTIAFNGVEVSGSGSLGNRVGPNSIFSNSGLGIDLGDEGPTANDAGDADAGPNGLQNKPVLVSAVTFGGETTV